MPTAQEADGLKVIDLGAGHSSSGETLCGRVIAALKSEALLNESVGAGYIERNWPPALKESGAWPLASLRQSFLNGSLTRLVDPDAILKSKIVEFVSRGDFGLASGRKTDGSYERVWFEELVAPDEVAFEAGVFLLRKDYGEGAQERGARRRPRLGRVPSLAHDPSPAPEPSPAPGPEPAPGATTKTLRLVGHRSARGLEPSRDEDPAEAAVGFRSDRLAWSSRSRSRPTPREVSRRSFGRFCRSSGSLKPCGSSSAALQSFLAGRGSA